MKLNKTVISLLILLLYLLMCGALTHFFDSCSIYVASWSFFLPLLLIGIKTAGLAEPNKVAPPVNWYLVAGWNLVLFIGCAVLYHNLVIIYIPPTLERSDIIPQIQVLFRRFLSGENPYAPITEFGGVMHPTYLPMQWLPYTVSGIFGFDPRWVAYVLFGSAIAVWSFCLRRYVLSWFAILLYTLLPYAVLTFIFWWDAQITGNTVEMGISGYYMFLVIAILFAGRSVQTLCVGICAVSRYSLALWIPFYFWMIWKKDGAPQLLRQLVLFLSIVCLLYIVPFLWNDPGSFMRGYTYHTQGALDDWNRFAANQSNHLDIGIGFARYFFDLQHLTMQDRLYRLKSVHFIFSALVPVIIVLFYWFKPNWFKSERLFSAGSFIIYLSFFYGFIQIPYTYLMLVPLFTSLIVFPFHFLGRNNSVN